MKNIESVAECTGCGGCAAICPQKIIKMQLNEEGFLKPVITKKEKCTHCGLCMQICPSNRKKEEKTIYGAYSAVSKEEHTIKTCASGGIAYEIAKHMLGQGYSLCGCRYHIKEKKAEHILVHNLEDYEACKSSKYIQSNTEEGITKMFSLLKQGGKAVFFGTPCQVSAVRKIAENKKVLEHLLLIDFFCHGVPTYFLWENYLNYLKKEKQMEKIKSVNFRDKNKGWHEYTVTVETEDGKVFSQSLEEKNWFFQFFLSDIVLNHACYSCSFRAESSEADIRIGDLWGTKYKENRKGVSGVLCFSKRGQEIIEQLKEICDIKEEEIDTVIEEQMKKNNRVPILRKQMISSLKKGKSFSSIYYSKVIPSKIYQKMRGEK